MTSTLRSCLGEQLATCYHNLQAEEHVNTISDLLAPLEALRIVGMACFQDGCFALDDSVC